MRGDGMDGLALAIFAAMVVIVAAGFLIPFLVARTAVRRSGWSAGRRHMIAFGVGVFGLGAGVLIVIATFFETTWAPPPTVRLDTPPGFAESWVFLLEDARAPTTLRWSGVEMPFSGKSTTIAVPRSGVLRVRSLDGIAGRADLHVMWSDGSANSGSGGGPAPKGSGATLYSAFNRVGANGERGAEPPWYDDTAMAAYVAARERGR